MAQENSLKEVAFWLNKLCINITGASDESVYPHFQASLNILSCTASRNTITGKKGVFLAVEKVKRKLARNNASDALRFQELYLILERDGTLKNIGEILNLLLSLSNIEQEADVLCPQFLTNIDDDCIPFRRPENQVRLTGRPLSCDLNLYSLHKNTSVFTVPNRVQSVIQFYKSLDASKPAESSKENGQMILTPSKHQTSFHKIPESVLLNDLIYAFQGIDGSHIVFNSQKNSYDASVDMPMNQKLVALRLSELGWLYRKVKQFCVDCSKPVMGNGLIALSLCESLEEHFNEHYRQLAILEAQIKGSVESPISLDKPHFTWIHLSVWALPPMSKFIMLGQLVDFCKGLKGGALVSKIYSFVNIGNPVLKNVVTNILTLTCKPFLNILYKWVYEGELDDPFNEFFVAVDNSVKEESWWHEKYHLRESMVPKFISGTLAKKIVGAGKNINFLRQICENWKSGNREEILKKSYELSVLLLLEEDQEGSLSKLINTEYKMTSYQVLQLLINNYNLFNHLRAVRHYLLGERGDFINYLMEHLEPELLKPAGSLYPHNMSSILEMTVRNTNAQYDDKDVLARLDTRMLEASPTDKGWDVFTLDYHVDGPIGTVLTAECMVQYRMLFNTLWKTKRMEMRLSNLWKQQMCAVKLYRAIPEVQCIMHSLHLLLSEMNRFINAMSFYMTAEVIECQLVCFDKQLAKSETLDEVISAHQSFLCNAFLRLFLQKNSKKLLTQLRAIYDLILQLGDIQEFVFNETEKELDHRLQYSNLIDQRGAQGMFGTTAQTEALENERRKDFICNFIPHAKAEIKVLKSSYQEMFHEFLLMLAVHPDASLQWLSYKLNFNDYHKKKDSRLSSSFTYKHRRLSLINTLS